MQTKYLYERCKLACGLEAVAMGFPEKAGYDMFFGSCADDIDGWTEQQFLNWTYLMDAKWGTTGTNRLMDLYKACSETMGRFGDYIPENV